MPEFQPADESDAATTPAAGDALFALALEATETRQRARLILRKATEPVEGPTATSYEQMNKWFRALMADTFA